MTRPILYSFRRCPYAMRARLGLHSAAISCDLREILLRDKAEELRAASPKATVPVLVIGETVIEESLEIMIWALEQNDPEGWLDMPAEGHALMAQCDGAFKTALDRYKYISRHPETDTDTERHAASQFLHKLDEKLRNSVCLYGPKPKLADMAIVTFVRQFAHVDREWFYAQDWPGLIRWLDAFKASDRFAQIMLKYEKWEKGNARVTFP